MTPEQAKALQKQNARLRSQQAPRRSSQQAISSETQSEVTERAPNLYRVPQINVPEDLQGVARLIQTELAKIEQSQTILLSLWEKVRDQANSEDMIDFKKDISAPTGIFSTIQAGSANIGPVLPTNNRALRISSYETSAGQVATEFIANGTDGSGVNQASVWFDLIPADDGSRAGGVMTVNCSQFKVNGTPIQSAQEIKRQVYAELFALNPGIVIPQTD
ncbi:TPA: hypothetical protein ACNIQM_001839 [Citrobacter werkmanii]